MGLQEVWGPLVAWDLFLAGAGAAAYLIGIIVGFMGEKYRSVERMGVFLGAPLVGLGAVILLVDLGQPLRFMLGFLNPQSSIMSIGIIFISIFLVLGAIHWLLQVIKKDLRLAWLGALNCIFALGTMSYTGLLLGVLKAIPFWNTPALPVLFITSALATGAGAILLGLAVKRWIRPAKAAEEEANTGLSLAVLSKIVIVVVAVELVILLFFMVIMGYTQGAAKISVNYLLSGDYALAFWLGIIVVGLLVPFVVEIFARMKSKSLPVARIGDLAAITGVCLLAGGIILRFAILSAGAPVFLHLVG